MRKSIVYDIERLRLISSYYHAGCRSDDCGAMILGMILSETNVNAFAHQCRRHRKMNTMMYAVELAGKIFMHQVIEEGHR